ncbi:MAG: methyltransferase [Candidatus Lambdaproteobacteria bacterium]|nr:methyltransferase [Candidatus Lambdaproteobacteria bacterium]
MAVHDSRTGETMHPGLGPWQEAQQLYVAGSQLALRLKEPAPAQANPPLTVFDVGLGAAANALAALACREALLAGPAAARRVRPLHLVSFEQELEPLRFAIAQAAQLGYPRGREALLQALLDQGRAEAAGVTWELRLGDLVHLIAEEPCRADVIFFDPFSPKANPELWSLPVLESLHGCRRPGSDTVLVTYSSAFSTRAALLLAGFYVGEGPRLGGRLTTVAATRCSLLAAPLDPGWLRRWRREREPWPLLSSPAARAALRERLLDHPQWSQVEEPPAPPAPRPGAPRRRVGKDTAGLHTAGPHTGGRRRSGRRGDARWGDDTRSRGGDPLNGPPRRDTRREPAPGHGRPPQKRRP